jgi:hypothetical protein
MVELEQGKGWGNKSKGKDGGIRAKEKKIEERQQFVFVFPI